MKCQYNRKKLCNDCDKYLVSCNKCKYIDSEGDCNNSNSKYYGDCVDGIAICCRLYKR